MSPRHAFRPAFLAALALAAAASARQAAPAPQAPAPGTGVGTATVVPSGSQDFRELAFEGEKPGAAALLRRHVEASGGEKAWESKSQARVRGTIDIPSAGLKGSMEMLTMSPDRMRMTMDVPGMGETRAGCDGTTGWTIDPMRGPALMGDAEVAELLRDGDFRRDLALARDAGSAEVVGLFEFAGAPCWRVRVPGTGKAPRDMHHFFDKETGLRRGMAVRLVTPMGELPAVIENSDYREFGDVRMPATTTTKVLGQAQVMRWDTVEWTGVDAAAFELPAEIKALKAAMPAPGGTDSPAAPAKPAAPPAPAAPAAPAGT